MMAFPDELSSEGDHQLAQEVGFLVRATAPGL